MTNRLSLLVIFLLSTISLLGILPLDTTRPSTSEWRLQAEVNVLLGIQAHNEGWHIDNLLPDTDMPLFDQDTGVMDRLGKSELEHLSLKSSLQEVLDLETENVVKLHLRLIQDPNSHQPPKESITLKQSAAIFFLQCQQVSGSRSDFGQAVLNPPDLTLVPETIFSDQLQLLVQSSLLERPPGSSVVLGILHGNTSVHHLAGFLDTRRYLL